MLTSPVALEDTAAPLDGWAHDRMADMTVLLPHEITDHLVVSAGCPVLVVATDRGTLKTAVRALRGGGFAVHTSRPPTTCEALERNPAAILVLDLTMPRLGGFEVLQQVHQEFEGQVPVVALTAGTEQTPSPRGWDWGLGRQGLGGYVEKPFSPERLVMVVYRVLVHSIAAKEPRLCHLSGKEIPLEEAKEILRSDDAMSVIVADLLKQRHHRTKERPTHDLSFDEFAERKRKIEEAIREHLQSEAARRLLATREQKQDQRRSVLRCKPIPRSSIEPPHELQGCVIGRGFRAGKGKGSL